MAAQDRETTRDPAQDPDVWNFTRWDPVKLDPAKGHIESTFIKLNDPDSPRALWVKLTIFSPTNRASGGPSYERGRTVAEAWAIAFDHTHAENKEGPPSYRQPPVPRGAAQSRHVAVKQTVPIEEATLSRTHPLLLEVNGVRYDGKRLSGEISHGSSTVRFELTLTRRDLAPLLHFPWVGLYKSAFPKQKIMTPILDAVADGWVEIVRNAGPSSRWEVERWPAMQGRNWGTGHSDTYAWAHCNVWHEPEGRELVFEGFSGKVRVGGMFSIPMTTIVAIRYRGVRYETRSVTEILRTRGQIEGLRRWTFRGEQAGASFDGSFSLRDDDTVGLYYPSPNGDMTYCLNSKLARATLRFAAHGRAPLVLTSDAAALEIGTHDAGHGIRMYV
jgi:hypothetical protein